MIVRYGDCVVHIFDIVKCQDTWATNLFNEELERIASEDIKLKKNYIDINLDDYYSFTLLINDSDELVAFSGLQKPGPWHSNIARIGTRYRIVKKFQTTGLLARTYDRSLLSGSKYMMPYQLRVAIDLDLDGVFFSRENTFNRKHLQSIADKCNEYENRTTYEVYPHSVNVCRLLKSGCMNNDDTCWQNAVIAKLKPDFDIGLPQRDVGG